LAAPALVPCTLALPGMIRWVESGCIEGLAPIQLKDFLLGQVKPMDLSHVLFPYRLNPVVGDSYMGLVPALLAVLGLFSVRRSWIVLFLFLLGGYSLLSTTGQHLGFAQLNIHIPMLNKIREPGRHLVVVILAFSALAGFGFQRLSEWVA